MCEETHVAVVREHRLDGGVAPLFQHTLKLEVHAGGGGRAAESVRVKDGVERLAMFVQGDGYPRKGLHIERGAPCRLAG